MPPAVARPVQTTYQVVVPAEKSSSQVIAPQVVIEVTITEAPEPPTLHVSTSPTV